MRHYNAVRFKLTDEQHEALSDTCEDILESPLPVAYLCYVEVFDEQPTNLQLRGFAELLEYLKDKKEGDQEKEGRFQVIQGGKNVFSKN